MQPYRWTCYCVLAILSQTTISNSQMDCSNSAKFSMTTWSVARALFRCVCEKMTRRWWVIVVVMKWVFYTVCVCALDVRMQQNSFMSHGVCMYVCVYLCMFVWLSNNQYRMSALSSSECSCSLFISFTIWLQTRGQSNLTKSASRGANSPVRGHPRGSKFVPFFFFSYACHLP